MKRLVLGVLVSLALGCAACGGGGGGDESAPAEADEESTGSRGADRSERTGQPPAAEGGEGGGEDGGEAAASTADEQDYIEALAPEFGGGAMPEEQVNCMVQAYVDVVGLERLREATSPEELAENPNLTPMDLGIELSPEDGETFYDLLSGCMDVRETFLTSLTGQDQAVGDCLNNAIDDALLRRYVVALFLGQGEEADPELQADMTEAFNSCAQLTAPPPQPEQP